MALPAKAMPPMTDEEDPAPGGMAPSDASDDGAAAGGEDAEGEGDDHEVLLTICKEADGTYRLIKGDEEDAAEGEPEEGAEAEMDVGQVFDSKGALLKAVLDVLNEDETSAGAPGSAEDQFAAGFDESSPAKPASPIPPKM